jgi:ribose 5-phosphate isomerase B
MTNIYIAGDHAGVEYKSKLVEFLKALKYTVTDLGTNSNASVDYPDYADKVAAKLKKEPEAFGILICGTGIGISIAANRHKHIRAALCHTIEEAKLSREHNNANVICLGARVTSITVAQGMVQKFLKTNFAGGRHANRVAKLN